MTTTKKVLENDTKKLPKNESILSDNELPNKVLGEKRHIGKSS